MKLNQSDYVLGHTDREQLRLMRQARILAPFTEHFLRDAGIVPGMRVLDIGCGMGDVTMLAAGLVGPAGRVVSIDMNQASIETERRSSFTDPKPFDAIVGKAGHPGLRLDSQDANRPRSEGFSGRRPAAAECC